MNRPEVALTEEALPEIYPFYKEYEPNPVVSKLGHGAMGAVLRPRIHMADEVGANINSLLENDTRLVLAINHQSMFDPAVVAGSAWQSPVLRPLVGKTSVLAMDSLFHSSTSTRPPADEPKAERSLQQFFRRKLVRPASDSFNAWLHDMLRAGVDNMGAIPTFRTNDPRHVARPGTISAELQKRASIGVVSTSVYRLDLGRHVAIFIEGKRNKHDVETVMPPEKGIGYIVKRAAHSVPVAIVPMGIAYHPKNKQNPAATKPAISPFHPEVVIGRPVTKQFGAMPVNAVVELSRAALQTSLSQAVQHCNNRKTSKPKPTCDI